VNPTEALNAPWRRTIWILTFCSAVAILFSIAVSQILLGLGLLALILSRRKLRFPPIKLPLAIFFLWTIAAMLLSPDARAGMPQLRKFFVFGIVLLIFNSVESVGQVRALVFGWVGVATLSALFSCWQFLNRYQEAVRVRAPLYDYLLDDRTRGFESHWMTFGGVEMIVFIMLLSALLFARAQPWKVYGWFCLLALWAGLILGFTRSIFLLGVPIGAIYLLWNWKRKVVGVLPVAAVVGFVLSPAYLRERIITVVKPNGNEESNAQRAVARRVGWEMVKAHPWFGLGPEQIQPQFQAWVPPDIPRPLPLGWYGHLHNIYLQYAAERGIPALAAIMWMIGKVIVDFVVELRRRPSAWDARYVLRGAIAATLAVLAAGFFEYNLGDSEVLTMFLSVIACGYSVIKLDRGFNRIRSEARTIDLPLSYVTTPEWMIRPSARIEDRRTGQ
jgi:O-antigen ligase